MSKSWRLFCHFILVQTAKDKSGFTKKQSMRIIPQLCLGKQEILCYTETQQ